MKELRYKGFNYKLAKLYFSFEDHIEEIAINLVHVWSYFLLRDTVPFRLISCLRNRYINEMQIANFSMGRSKPRHDLASNKKFPNSVSDFLLETKMYFYFK